MEHMNSIESHVLEYDTTADEIVTTTVPPLQKGTVFCTETYEIVPDNEGC